VTPFERALAKGNAAARATNGELLRITEMLPSRHKSAQPDPEKTPRDIIGIFLKGPDRTRITDNTLGRELDSAFVVAPTSALFHASELMVGGVLVLPKRTNRVERTTKVTEPTYEITAIEPTGGGDYVARLVEVDP